MNKYFYCYSYPLKEFMISNGLTSVVSGIHPNTGKKYWVFEGDEKLNSLLAEWRSRRR